MSRRLVPTLLLVLATGCVLFAPNPRLHLTGTVRSAVTGAAVAGAKIRVLDVGGMSCFVGCINDKHSGAMIAEGESDADGSYSMMVPPPPGYGLPNCYVMAVEFSAPGYATVVSGIRDSDTSPTSNGTCTQSLRGTASALLPPAP